MTVGERIKNRRIELGMTQEELAVKLGYKSKASVNKIELGVQDLPQKKIAAFAAALETSPGVLMGWNDTDTSADTISSLKAESIRIAQSLLNNPDLRELLETAAKLDPEQVKLATTLLKQISPQGTTTKKPADKTG